MFLSRVTHGQPISSATALPSTPPLPMAAQTMLWGLRPVQYLTWCQRRYGDMFTVKLPGGRASVVVAGPEAVKDVFTLPADSFAVADLAPLLEPFLGARSVLVLDGDRHRRERRLLTRAFHGEAMTTYAEIITASTERNLATWPNGRSFAARPNMEAITLDVILRAVFGVVPETELAHLRERLGQFLTKVGSVLILNPSWQRDLGRWSPWRRFVRLRAEVHELIATLIAQRRRAGDLASRHDVLSILLQARDENDDAMNDLELRDELITMLLAGHDTTATALAWALDLLVHYPDVLARLVNGLDDGDETYLQAVVKEVLRLRPVVPDASRTLTRDATIGGRRLPAGTTVTPCILLVQRHRDSYGDPLAFRPERFLDPMIDMSAWIPFGGGIRRCLGAPFATLEITVVLRTVLSRMRLRAADCRPSRPRRRVVTLVPNTGARIIATPVDYPAPTHRVVARI